MRTGCPLQLAWTIFVLVSTASRGALLKQKESTTSLLESEASSNFFMKSICETGLEIDLRRDNKLTDSSKCIDEVLQNTHDLVMNGGSLTLMDILAYQHEDGCRGKTFRSEEQKQQCLWTNPNWVRKIANILSITAHMILKHAMMYTVDVFDKFWATDIKPKLFTRSGTRILSLYEHSIFDLVERRLKEELLQAHGQSCSGLPYVGVSLGIHVSFPLSELCNFGIRGLVEYTMFRVKTQVRTFGERSKLSKDENIRALGTSALALLSPIKEKLAKLDSTKVWLNVLKVDASLCDNIDEDTARTRCLSDTLHANFITLIAKGFDNFDTPLHNKLKSVVASINTVLLRDHYAPLIDPRTRREGEGFCSPLDLDDPERESDVCCHLPETACMKQENFKTGARCKWNADSLESLESVVPEVQFCKEEWRKHLLADGFSQKHLRLKERRKNRIGK
jgi:hypothetical protein